jgi:hypothetical protein
MAMPDSTLDRFPVPDLPLSRYELTVRAVEPVSLPPLAGPMWRGVLGRALKRIEEGADPAPRGVDPAATQPDRLPTLCSYGDRSRTRTQNLLIECESFAIAAFPVSQCLQGGTWHIACAHPAPAYSYRSPVRLLVFDEPFLSH